MTVFDAHRRAVTGRVEEPTPVTAMLSASPAAVTVGKAVGTVGMAPDEPVSAELVAGVIAAAAELGAVDVDAADPVADGGGTEEPVRPVVPLVQAASAPVANAPAANAAAADENTLNDRTLAGNNPTAV